MAREYRNLTKEDKIKKVKMVLVENKSQMEVERNVLSKIKENTRLRQKMMNKNI